MISGWWVLAALIGGGSLGMLIMSLVCISGGLPEQRIDLGDLGTPT